MARKLKTTVHVHPQAEDGTYLDGPYELPGGTYEFEIDESLAALVGDHCWEGEPDEVAEVAVEDQAALDITTLTAKQLQELAVERGLDPTGLRKSELVELLSDGNADG